jgi:hypothetical protein
MTVWVGVKGHARHDARIKVCMMPGERMDADNTAVVAIQPEQLGAWRVGVRRS